MVGSNPSSFSRCSVKVFRRNIRFRLLYVTANVIRFSESEKHGLLDKNQCPYLSSVLLENMRWHPGGDSLPHQATENIIIGDYEIKKGTSVVG